jgi:hypothetical protein
VESVGNFGEAIGKGYVAGQEAKQKREDRDLERAMKFVDMQMKMDQQKLTNETLNFITGAKESEARTSAFQNLGAPAPGDADKSNGGKLSGMLGDPATATKRGFKTEIGISDGKPSFKITQSDPKTSTVDQLEAIQRYVDKKDPSLLPKAFPGGEMPDWATKFMASAQDHKLKADALREEKMQYRMGKDIVAYTEKYEKNPVVAELKKQGVALGQVDQMIALTRAGNTVSASAMGTKMARAMGEVGVLTESDIKRYVQSGKLTQGAADKLSKWLTGAPSEATLEEISQISEALRDSYAGKVQPIANTYIERLARNYKLDPEEAAFRMDLEYKPKGMVRTEKGAGTPKKIGRFEVTVED